MALQSRDESLFMISAMPLGENMSLAEKFSKDYTCPICGITTSHMCTKLKCDCHIEHQIMVEFNGILHLPYISRNNQMNNDPESADDIQR
jgi:hypothetical protein